MSSKKPSGHAAMLRQCAQDDGFGYRCIFCQHEFQKKLAMSNHLGACALLHPSETQKNNMVEAPVFTRAELSRQIETLAKQVRFLKDTVDKLNTVKKKKACVLTWLNAKTQSGQCVRPAEMSSDEFWRTCCVPTLEILNNEVLANGSLMDGAIRVIEDGVDRGGGKGMIPLRIFSSRPDVMFHFTEASKWELCPPATIDVWIRKVNHGLFKLFSENLVSSSNGNLERLVAQTAELNKWSDTKLTQKIKRWLKDKIVQEIGLIELVEFSVFEN